MSELITNLQHIYNIKLELKDVLETDSDLFEEYPDIVAEKIAQGGGSATPVDPWNNYISVADMIMEELTEADYVGASIMSDFWTDVYGSEWNETVWIDTGEVDGNDEPIMEEKTVRYAVSGDGTGIATDLEDYPDLYGSIFPILQNVTLIDPSLEDPNFDPEESGYNYLLEGELYAWNLNDISGPVVEITENGFYPCGSDVTLGYNVNVPTTGIVLDGGVYWHIIPFDGDVSINIAQSANSYVNIVNFTGYNVDSEEPDMAGNSFHELYVVDANDNYIVGSYGAYAYNEGANVSFILNSTTTIKMYNKYWYWMSDEPEDPEMMPSYYLNDESEDPICANADGGYILEDLPAGNYSLTVKWATTGQQYDIVILNHINVSDECVSD